MSSVKNPSAVIQARVRKAKELEVSISREGGALPATMLGEESKLSKPAKKEEVEAFVKANNRWLHGEASDILMSMSPVDQKRVIAGGTLSGCRDPVAVMQTRAKKAREIEMEFENLAAGRGPRKTEPPRPTAPTFGQEAAEMQMFAPPQEVSVTESRFAPLPDADTEDTSTLFGESLACRRDLEKQVWLFQRLPHTGGRGDQLLVAVRGWQNGPEEP